MLQAQESVSKNTKISVASLFLGRFYVPVVEAVRKQLLFSSEALVWVADLVFLREITTLFLNESHFRFCRRTEKGSSYLRSA